MRVLSKSFILNTKSPLADPRNKNIQTHFFYLFFIHFTFFFAKLFLKAMETIFNPISVSYTGIGTTVRLLNGNFDTNLTELIPSSFTFVTLNAGINDPGFAFQGLSNSSTDSLYTDAEPTIPYIQTITDLNALNLGIILNIMIPHSWTSFGALSSTLALNSYATLVVSGYNYFSNLGAYIQGVEIVNSPDLTTPHVSASSMVYLAQRIQNVASLRNFPKIKLIGPSISSVTAQTTGTPDYNYSYLQVTPQNTFTIWSINGKENSVDSSIINAGTFASRMYMQNQLTINSTQMDFSTYGNCKVIQRLVTTATIFPSGNTLISNFNVDVSDTIYYGIRLAENFIGALSRSFGAISIAKLTYDSTTPLDINSMYDISNLKRSFYDLLNLISLKLPVNGSIYQAETLSNLDYTMKVTVMNSDSMGFCCMMSTPSITSFNGLLTLKIKNNLWSDAYQFTNFSFSAYPVSTDVSDCSVFFSEILQDCDGFGYGIFKLDNLPSGTIIFFNATLGLVPPVILPVPVPPNILIETIIQVFTYNGIPTGSFSPGTIYFNLNTNKTMVYSSGAWIETTLYTG